MTTYLITSPDGRKFKVSGNGTKEEALAHFQQQYAQPSGPDFSQANAGPSQRPELQAALDAKAATAGDNPEGWIAPLSQGLTLGFGDEMLGGIGGLITAARGKGFSKGYDALTKSSRKDLEAERQRHPVRSAALEIAGSLPAAAAPIGKIAQGAKLLPRMWQGAKAGAVLGGVYGAGTAEGGLPERATGALTSGAVGAATGAAAPVIGQAIGKVFGKRAAAKAVPSFAERKAAGQALYKQADQAGVTIAPQSFANSTSDLVAKLNVAGIDKDIQPKAFAAAQKIVKAANTGQPATLQDMDIFRQVASEIARDHTAGSNEKRIASQIISHLDDFMENLKPVDVISGDPKKALPLVAQARKLWKIKAKAETIQRAISDAGNAASGVENGLRNEFRKLLKTGRYNWTPDERAAIERVVRGGLKENALRFFGTFGIPIDQGRNWLGALAGGGVGSAFGPLGTVAVPAAGTLAKYGARRAAESNAQAALKTALAGGARPFDAQAAMRARIGAEQLLRPALPAIGLPTFAASRR